MKCSTFSHQHFVRIINYAQNDDDEMSSFAHIIVIVIVDHGNFNMNHRVITTRNGGRMKLRFFFNSLGVVAF